jgi:hypothetical protein
MDCADRKASSPAAVKLTGRSLIETCLFLQPQNPDGFEKPQCAKGIRIGRILRRLKGNLDMALGGDVVYLVRLNILHNADQVRGVGEVAIVHNESHIRFMAVLI